jgi:polar amino acid transport system substrate-binding protein
MASLYRWLCILAASALALSACTAVGERAVIESEADFAGHRLGTLTGTIYEIQLDERTDLEASIYGSLADGANALKTGKIDALIADETAFSESELRRLRIRKSFTLQTAYPTAFAFRKGDSTLVNAYNDFFRELQASGEYDRMLAYWFGPDDPDPAGYPVVEAYTEGEPLRYANTETQPPLAFFARGQWRGLEIELIQRFAAYLKRPCEIRFFEMSSRLLNLQMGKADMVGGCIFVTDERSMKVDFGDPYFHMRPGCFVVDDEALLFRGGLRTQVKSAVKQNFFVEQRWKMITDGLRTTLQLTLWSILFGSLLGILLCWMAMGRSKPLQAFAKGYDAFMHGIPPLVLLLVLFYVVLAGSGWDAKAIAIAALSLNFASAASDVFQTSIKSVPRGQTEASLALGFSKLHTFLNIVLPQAVRNGLPLFQGECISLLKGTSIVGYIAVIDITRACDLIRARTFDAFLPLLAVTVIYFILAWLIGLLLKIFYYLCFKLTRTR